MGYAPAMRRVLLWTLAAVWFAAFFPAPATAREPYANFYTPAKAVLCSAVVDITGENSNYVPWLFCWTPNDGFTVSLSASRRPSTRALKRYKWHYEPGGRTLRFGQAWWLNRDGVSGWGSRGTGDVLIRCVSRSSSLTCTNRAGHGFWLGRFPGYRPY